jgi:nucleoside-diphosphate-sugar epimerase
VSQTLLITGVAGFIGSHVAAEALRQGYRVIGMDNLNDYYDVRLKHWRLAQLLGCDPQVFASNTPATLTHGRFEWHFADIENRVELGRCFSSTRLDAVIHLAARAGVRKSIEEPAAYARTNLEGLVNVMECMRERSVHKLILASSSSLYAGHQPPFYEDVSSIRPISPYAASKLGAEAMASTYHTLYGLDISVLRYFTVYGPAGRPDMSPLLFAHKIANGQPLTIFGDGKQSRDFTHVSDIARGTLMALKPLGYEIINLGNGVTPLQLIEMIHQLEAGLGQKATLVFSPANASDMPDTLAITEKAYQLLGWKAEISAQEGFSQLAQWYLNNREWLAQLSF